MAYISSSSVRVSAWVAVNDETEITYQVYPASDVIEITLGGRNGLDLQMSEAGLHRCVTAFVGALGEFAAATPGSPDAAHVDLIPSVDPPTDRAEHGASHDLL
ncbi:MAG: hypothetical protein ACRDSR_06820 [Pseudonocardiaceae bacterium]